MGSKVDADHVIGRLDGFWLYGSQIRVSFARENLVPVNCSENVSCIRNYGRFLGYKRLYGGKNLERYGWLKRIEIWFFFIDMQGLDWCAMGLWVFSIMGDGRLSRREWNFCLRRNLKNTFTCTSDWNF
ncbi:hypothetical protein V6N12_062594 [Hibiscus sabdariffa]|uniref:Uncharacterized protein n=1 Tax=Hibiscus sabdariffa TaxID=183260 RepID=A0ABR2F9K3_9ROSI